ncbi:hypothetical protein, partial [Methanoculleus chikugoensis]|uniref:hypothetical protein n=1 Tax=Methanoculleus chikugoensis TaxID=118126 RepID=UPI001FB41828
GHALRRPPLPPNGDIPPTVHCMGETLEMDGVLGGKPGHGFPSPIATHCPPRPGGAGEERGARAGGWGGL